MIFDDPTVFEFLKLGFIMNLVAWILGAIVYNLKAATLDRDTFEELLRFYTIRKQYIRSYNTPMKRIANNLLIFFPFYTFILTGIKINVLTKYKGLFAFIMADTVANKYGIFNMVSYTLVESSSENNK